MVDNFCQIIIRGQKCAKGSSQQGEPLCRWRSRRSFEIKTIRHVISLRIPLVKCGESEDGFAETDQTDVRAQAPRDAAGSRERADDKTANPRAITELCSLVGWLRCRKLPSFDVRRVHMVVPSTPTIPSYENGDSRPEPALYDGFYLVDSPLHA